VIKCNRCGKGQAIYSLFSISPELPRDIQQDYCASCYDTLVRIIQMFNEGSPLYTGYVDDPTIITSGTP